MKLAKQTHRKREEAEIRSAYRRMLRYAANDRGMARKLRRMYAQAESGYSVTDVRINGQLVGSGIGILRVSRALKTP